MKKETVSSMNANGGNSREVEEFHEFLEERRQLRHLYTQEEGACERDDTKTRQLVDYAIQQIRKFLGGALKLLHRHLQGIYKLNRIGNKAKHFNDIFVKLQKRYQILLYPKEVPEAYRQGLKEINRRKAFESWFISQVCEANKWVRSTLHLEEQVRQEFLRKYGERFPYKLAPCLRESPPDWSISWPDFEALPDIAQQESLTIEFPPLTGSTRSLEKDLQQSEDRNRLLEEKIQQELLSAQRSERDLQVQLDQSQRQLECLKEERDRCRNQSAALEQKYSQSLIDLRSLPTPQMMEDALQGQELLKKELQQLRQLATELEEEKRISHSTILERDQTIKLLQQQQSELQCQLDASQERFKSLTEDSENLRSQNLAQDRRNTELTELTVRQQESISVLTKQCEVANELKCRHGDVVQHDTSDLSKIICELESQLLCSSQQIQSLRHSETYHRDFVSILQGKLQEAEQVCAVKSISAESCISDLRRELKSLQEEFDEQEQRFTSFVNQVSKMRAKNSELEESLAEAQKKNEKLEEFRIESLDGTGLKTFTSNLHLLWSVIATSDIQPENIVLCLPNAAGHSIYNGVEEPIRVRLLAGELEKE